jgi:hypothetical protein
VCQQQQHPFKPAKHSEMLTSRQVSNDGIHKLLFTAYQSTPDQDLSYSFGWPLVEPAAGVALPSTVR